MSEPAAWWILTRSESTGSTRTVALTLAICADAHGYVDMSVGKLCTLTRLSERTVQYATTSLSELGELSVTPGKGCNRYRLLCPDREPAFAPPADGRVAA